ncbi:hypothetical protein KGA66_23235 [Actinocrinis puniceicyclus]|uniref:SPFH domain / Band 7 family protein n=1 Tax=Actinocrinis puniceicyclus TaxID=977794 RepID=A0A8J8BGP2_9ACTN|nr:hypothetical protein [Actinocrinis puniceicyclus]MBS2965979.1 hypothetical protein [Actinocrinis puniceicyclus]
MADPSIAEPEFAPGQLFSGPHAQPGARRPHVVPGVAHVFVTADGEFLVSTRRPTMGEAFAAKRRYDVDLRNKDSDLSGDDLPTRENAVYFEYQISLTWRVHDPVEVLERGISDADTVIKQSLVPQMRDITMQIAPEDWRTAERSLNNHFAAGRQLPNGITVVSFAAQLKLDSDLRTHLTTITAVKNQHLVDNLNRQAVEDALRSGDMGIVVEYLTKNTDATRDVLKLFLESRLANERNRQELGRLMLDKVEKGAFQDIDVQWLLQPLLPQGGGFSAAPQLFGPTPPALTGGTQPPPPIVTAHATIGMSPAAPAVQQPVPAATQQFSTAATSAAQPTTPPAAGPPAPPAAPKAPAAPARPPKPAVGGVIEWVDVEQKGGS